MRIQSQIYYYFLLIDGILVSILVQMNALVLGSLKKTEFLSEQKNSSNRRGLNCNE